MQYTMNKAKSVVMGLWISSLILSIASAINSQLVIHWRTAMYRSPQELLPADLTLAVKICAGTLVAAACIVLLAVSTWDILEWWEEKAKEIKLQQAPTKNEEIADMHILREWWLGWKGLKAQRRGAGEPNRPPVAIPARERAKASRSTNATLLAIWKRWRRWKDRKVREGVAGQPNERQVIAQALESPEPSSTRTVLAARERFQMLVRKVILYRWLQEFVDLPLVFEPKRHSSQLNRLYDLHPVHELQAFHPFGYDISFSPDGSHLAVGEMKGNVAIWQVDNLDREPEKIIKCPVERARFAWSPNSSHLVITTKKGLVIQDTTSWSKPVSYRTTREPAVVAWLQSASPCHVIGVVQDTLHIFNAESKATTTPKIDAHPSVTVLDLASIPPPQSLLGLVLVLGIMKDEASDSYKVGRPRTASVERWLIRKSS
ncbi:hypothetical protein FS837_003369 [Tulasnella sp. UAMH 9824]|nr:hypothetical protein FS837_003369 [Tulasnella sp. UAMH 9824]